MLETVGKCESKNCGAVAVAVVHWPGRSLRMCERCNARAVEVAAAMGFVVSSGGLTEDQRG